MESAQEKVEFKYIIHSEVERVEQVFETVNAHKEGDEVVTEKVNRGWFVHFEGSRELIFFGMEKPQLDRGDKIKITFERMPNALTTPTSK